jgi:dTDP-4-dehydrorhamnose 3,5-epimerase
MRVIKSDIEGVVIIEPRIFADNRGYFYEVFTERDFAERDFAEQVCPIHFVQQNEAKSSYGVVRGLHFQLPPHAQSKLVRVTKGRVLDVVVDIRRSSPTFGKHIAVELSDENHLQLFIPRGFAHGYSVLSDEAVMEYKCDNYYAPKSEGGILWNDTELAIDWQVAADKVILSEKDKHYPTLAECNNLFE